jgi:hypothetical protein
MLAAKFSCVQVFWKGAELGYELMSKCQGLLRPLKKTLGESHQQWEFESFLWKGSRLTMCHASLAEVGLLPTATDLVSLIAVQR